MQGGLGSRQDVGPRAAAVNGIFPRKERLSSVLMPGIINGDDTGEQWSRVTTHIMAPEGGENRIA
jgi:hypothetical protein